MARRGLTLKTRPKIDLNADWHPWLKHHFPRHVKHGFAPHHEQFWQWVWSIGDDRPRPFVLLVARGGGKSSSAELAVSSIGLRVKRPYVLYVSGAQEQADKHVSTVAGQLESFGAERAVNKYGSSKGWRRNQLRTADGFTVDALGLDTAARGIKIDENRPGLIVFDDIDEKHDSPLTTQKKTELITHAILPAGADNCAVLFVQNIIHRDSIAARLADGRADFLIDRITCGPIPSIRGLKIDPTYDAEIDKIRSVIVGGEATWEGQSLEICQQDINDYGLRSFLEECQHEVDEVEGALWTKTMIDKTRVGGIANLKRIVVGVDPSGGGDDIGIVVAGIDNRNHGYILEDATQPGRLGPQNWGRKVIVMYDKWKADNIVAEKNFGGDMVAANIKALDPSVPVKMVEASRGKMVRAEPIATRYGEEIVHHVAYHTSLESEMTSWLPASTWSPNRMDAMVWALTELMIHSRRIVDRV